MRISSRNYKESVDFQIYNIHRRLESEPNNREDHIQVDQLIRNMRQQPTTLTTRRRVLALEIPSLFSMEYKRMWIHPFYEVKMLQTVEEKEVLKQLKVRIIT